MSKMAIFQEFSLLLIISSTSGSSLFDLERSLDLRSPVPCAEVYQALVDAMELQKEIYGDAQNVFTGLGFSLDRKEQLKEFICKIPGISTVRQLASITPLHDYSIVSEIYENMLNGYRRQGLEAHQRTLQLFYRINTLGRELDISVPSNFATIDKNRLFSLFGDKKTMKTFFSSLAREFGPSFPAYLSSGGISRIQFRDVAATIDTFQTNADDLEGAASALQIPSKQLEQFLRLILYIIKEDPRVTEFYRRSAASLDKLDAIGFFSLS